MTTPSIRGLDDAAHGAVRDFLRRLEGRYDVVDAIVFGSRARGEATSESDIDLAVVLAGQPQRRFGIAWEMAGIAAETLLATSEVISPMPFWRDELEGNAPVANPRLIAGIRRDGVSLLTPA